MIDTKGSLILSSVCLLSLKLISEDVLLKLNVTSDMDQSGGIFLLHLSYCTPEFLTYLHCCTTEHNHCSSTSGMYICVACAYCVWQITSLCPCKGTLQYYTTLQSTLLTNGFTKIVDLTKQMKSKQ